MVKRIYGHHGVHHKLTSQLGIDERGGEFAWT